MNTSDRQPPRAERTSAQPPAAPKRAYVKPKLTFISPKLTHYGSISEITGQFFDTFTPPTPTP